MQIDLKSAWAFIVERMQERTTWLGLIAAAAAIGWRVAPEHIELIVQGGMVLGAFLMVAIKEKPATTTVVLMTPAT